MSNDKEKSMEVDNLHESTGAYSKVDGIFELTTISPSAIRGYPNRQYTGIKDRSRRTTEISFGDHKVNINKEYLGIDLVYWISGCAGTLVLLCLCVCVCCYCPRRCCRKRSGKHGGESFGTMDITESNYETKVPLSNSDKYETALATKQDDGKVTDRSFKDDSSSTKRSFALWTSPSDNHDAVCVY
jgi:hypothetical protein